MRTLDIGTRRYTAVDVTDEPGAGGACHEYQIRTEPSVSGGSGLILTNISFQNGPINEHGVNGVHQEDLLAIIIDRLKSFQSGAFSCRENALAITKIEEAMHWLNHRTSERQARGVEGTSAA